MNCEKCGSEMIVKTNTKNNQQFWACTGYPNCKNTKPLEAGQVRNSPVKSAPAPSSAARSEVININENADSIEWRMSTGKGVKIYCDVNKPDEAKQKLENAIKILQEVDSGFVPIEKPGTD